MPVSKRKMIAGAWGFTIAVGIALFFGYSVGKDMALRDNAADRMGAVEASR